MFISESYIHFQNDFLHTAEDDEFVDISFDLNPFKQYSDRDDEDIVVKAKYLSKSEDCLYQKKKVSSSRGYDGDTDSDANEIPVERATPLARCDICKLDFMHDILDNRDLKGFNVKKKKWKRKSKTNFNHKASSMQCIDFEDYKDASHKMEVFAADSERKWTLQYQYQCNGERNHQMLAKVIIGRGQADQYPELNNIHLIQELKDYKQYKWRNDCLEHLKSRNKMMRERFSLLPSLNMCLFCFNERNNDILQNLQNSSLHAFILPYCIVDECLNDSRKCEDQQNISSDGDEVKEFIKRSPGQRGHEIQNLKTEQPRNQNENHRYRTIEQTLTNQTKRKKGRSARNNSFSDKIIKKLSKKVVDIELSDVNDKTYRSISDEMVNVVLMYAEKPQNYTKEQHKNKVENHLQNAKKPRNGMVGKNTHHFAKDKKEKLENNSSNPMGINKSEINPKSQVRNETSRIKERRKIKRTFSGKLFRKSKATEEEIYEDEDEDFVVIL